MPVATQVEGVGDVEDSAGMRDMVASPEAWSLSRGIRLTQALTRIRTRTRTRAGTRTITLTITLTPDPDAAEIPW